MFGPHNTTACFVHILEGNMFCSQKKLQNRQVIHRLAEHLISDGGQQGAHRTATAGQAARPRAHGVAQWAAITQFAANSPRASSSAPRNAHRGHLQQQQQPTACLLGCQPARQRVCSGPRSGVLHLQRGAGAAPADPGKPSETAPRAAGGGEGGGSHPALPVHAQLFPGFHPCPWI